MSSHSSPASTDPFPQTAITPLLDEALDALLDDELEALDALLDDELEALDALEELLDDDDEPPLDDEDETPLDDELVSPLEDELVPLGLSPRLTVPSSSKTQAVTNEPMARANPARVKMANGRELWRMARACDCREPASRRKSSAGGGYWRENVRENGPLLLFHESAAT